MNPYSVMGVKPSTSFEDAKRIYRKKMLELHPDRGGDPEDMKKVKEAWDLLKSNKSTMLGQKTNVSITHKSLFNIIDK